VGAAVIATWVILAVSGHWHSERSWIDRTGRMIGIGWVLDFLLSTGLEYEGEIMSTQGFQRLQAKQELEQKHKERQRNRQLRFNDLQALRKLFLAESSTDKVKAVDKLLNEWQAWEEREISEEERERESLKYSINQTRVTP
jgi:hypothetical protein